MKEGIFNSSQPQKKEEKINGVFGRVMRKVVLIGALAGATLGAVEYGGQIKEKFEQAVTPESHKGNGIITSKEHLTSKLAMIGKIISEKPEKWIIHFSLNGKENYFEVPQQEFDSLNEGDSLIITYETGGLTLEEDGIHIQSVEIAK